MSDQTRQKALNVLEKWWFEPEASSREEAFEQLLEAFIAADLSPTPEGHVIVEGIEYEVDYLGEKWWKADALGNSKPGCGVMLHTFTTRLVPVEPKGN